MTSCFGFATLVAVPCGWQLDFVGQAAEPERFAGVINLKALRVIRVTRIPLCDGSKDSDHIDPSYLAIPFLGFGTFGADCLRLRSISMDFR